MQSLLDREGTIEGVQGIIEQAQQMPDAHAIMVLSCDENEFTPEELNPVLREVSVPLFGGTFPGIIHEHEKLNRGSIVLPLPAPADLHILRSLSDPARDFALELDGYLAGSSLGGSMFVFVDGMARRISALIDALFEQYGLEMNYLGGGCGSLSLEQKPCIFTNEGLLEDAAVLAYLNLNSGVGVAHGWDMISEPMKVTRSDRNVVYRLDHRPALEVYRELIEEGCGESFTEENFFDIAKAHPFGLHKLQSETVIRDPLSLDADEGLVCVGEVPTGAFVHLMRGETEELIDAAQEANERALQSLGNPAGFDLRVFFDCISRVLFMGSEFKRELEVVSDRVPMIGALTLGEIANSRREFLEFYNKTSVVGLLSSKPPRGGGVERRERLPERPAAAPLGCPSTIETEILLEITLGLNGSLELEKMTHDVLSKILRLLNCSGGLVIRRLQDEDASKAAEFTPIATIPDNLELQRAYREFMTQWNPGEIYDLLAGREEDLPFVTAVADVFVHVFRLEDFGLLVIIRHSAPLPGSFQRAFGPVASKLAWAAWSCVAAEDLQLAAQVFETVHNGIFVTDADNRILRVNPAFTAITGYSAHEVLGKTPEVLSSGYHDKSFYDAMWRALRTDGHWKGDIWNRRKNGELYPQLTSITTTRSPSGDLSHYVVVFSDVTLARQHEQELTQLAHHDVLTGLPNRRLLEDRISQGMAQTRRSGRLMAVALLDLNEFKPINDRWGHEVGDEVLKAVGQRLQGVLRGGDTAARIGGDEFVVVLLGIKDETDCVLAAERILTEIKAPITLDLGTVQVSGSLGVTLFPDDEQDADGLLRHADQAMYLAKRSSTEEYHLFNRD